MFELLCWFIILYFAFMLGRIYQLFEIRKVIRKISKQNGIDLSNLTLEDDEEITRFILLEIENVNDTLLLYNSETNEFICQSSSLEEAAEKFNNIKKNTTGEVIYENSKIYFVNGKIIEGLKFK